MPTPIDTSGLARALVVNSPLALQRGADNSNADYLRVARTQDLQAQEATRRAVRENGLERLDASRDGRSASSPRAVEEAISNISGRLEAARSEITEQLASTASPSARQGLLEDLNKIQSAIDGTNPVGDLIEARAQARQASSPSDVPDAAAQFQGGDENSARADGPEREPASSFSLSPDRQQNEQAQELQELRREEIREDQRLRQEQLEEQAEERARERREETREEAIEEREDREERERELEREREREQVREAYLEERARDAAAAYQALQEQRREPRVFDASA